MSRFSNFISTVFISCSLISFFFYWILYLKAVTDNKNEVNKENSIKHSLEERLYALENGLKENQIIINNLSFRIKDFIKNVQYRNTKSAYKRTDLCNVEKIDKSNSFNLTIEQLYNNLPFDDPNGGVWTQGWDIKINDSRFNYDDPLKIFIVPHSHNDCGWLKTYEQYYRDQTNFILDNMLEMLQENQKMTFIWAEISYFAYWYDNLKSEDSKEMVKTLIDNGQLEIVTGGWVMNDEANTHYFSMLSQMVDGHEWLLHNLNYKPKIGWAIDPFGVSPTMAYLLKKMGFKGMVVQRIHYALKKYLARNQYLEFNWKQSWETNDYNENHKDILCHVMPFYSYDIPHTCGPDPKVCCQFDFMRISSKRMYCPWKINPSLITENNIAERALTLLDQYKKKAMLYKTNNLLVPLGDDFRYNEKKEWTLQYTNYIKLFNYINSRPELNTKIRFATLSDYFESLLKEIPIEKSLTFSGDFFTYADKEDNYWSGYFVTRPFYKRYDRVLQFHLRSAEILFSFYSVLNGGKNNINSELINDLKNARSSLSIFQHHDAITGTARTHVVQDYAKRMFSAIKSTQKIISSLTSFLFYLPLTSLSSPIEFIDNYPIDNLPIEDEIFLNEKNDYTSLFLYNSLAKKREEKICFKIFYNNSWILRDTKGKLINDVQLNNLTTLKKNYNHGSQACFVATLNPISISQYSIEINSANVNYEESKIIEETLFNLKNSNKFDFILKTDKIKLVFSKETGLLEKYFDLQLNEEYLFDINFYSYGTRKFVSKERSGAYLFLPDNETPKKLEAKSVKLKVTIGKMISEIETIIDAGILIKNKIILKEGEAYFDLQNEFHLGIENFSNKELLMRIKTDIKNKNIFYTDLNGLQMTKRQYLKKLPLQGNVYPMPTISYIEDLKARVNIISGQPLGVTSSTPSTIDIFLDRLLLQDDLRGLGQGITDNKPTREIFRIFIEKTPNESKKLSLSAQLLEDKLMNPVLKMKSSFQSSQGTVEFFKTELLCDIHLLNLRTNLNTMADYNLYLHKYSTSCETKCFDSETLFLNKTLRDSLINVLDEKVELLSLTSLHKESEINLIKDEFFINENDFKVLGLKLKE